MPDGKPRHFIRNKDKPYLDLRLLSEKQARLICKNWMDNIILSLKNNKKRINNNFVYDDLHIVTNINEMNNDIDKDNLYFSWQPKSTQGINEILFVVIVNLDAKQKIMQIKNVIQSPFWDSE